MNLYRRKTFPASLALLLVCLFALTIGFAQQRRKPHKLRATGLLELTTSPTGTVTARLIPVAILDQGRFENASIYKAAPQPMAIEKGIVYEVQKSGVPVGYVTLTNASKTAGIWTSLGKWQPAAVEEAKQSTPVQPANPGDDRPRLHRGDAGSAPASATPTPTAAPAAQSTPTPEPEEPEDTDRPVLRRRSPGGNAPEPEATPSPAGKPTPQAGTVPPAAPVVNTPGTQTFAAVSDAQPSETRSYQFVWKPGEQEKAEEQMRRLALAQLPRENAQLNESSMKNVIIRSFDLDLSNDAIMVLTAEVPGSYVAPGRKGAPGTFVSRYITLIARTSLEGPLQRLAVSITDSSRLDVAPRLELIDAVDVDGDGPAELLFREYSFDEKGFIIYGIGRGAVTKVFEGATSPLP